MTENIQNDKTNIDDLIDLLPEQFPSRTRNDQI